MNRQRWRIEPDNEHTEMNKLNTAVIPHEPTRDEIALHAFLIWEKNGRQSGREQTYWLQAEAQLRQARQEFAQLTAVKSARPWPPQTAAAPAAPKLASARAVTPAAPKATKLATASRGVAMKPTSMAKPLRKSAPSAPARKALARN